MSPRVVENRFAYFRLAFTLAEPVSTLPMAISACSRYRLWLNGVPLLSGPCKGDRWRHYYEELDVGPQLRPGHNLLAAQVLAYRSLLVHDPDDAGMPLFAIASLPIGPQLAVRGQALGQHGELLADLTTGVADWQVQLDDAITLVSDRYTVYLGAICERVDARRIPAGWKTALDLDGQWHQATALLPAAGKPDENLHGIVPQLPLRERPIPLLSEIPRGFVREMPIQPGDHVPLSFERPDSTDGWTVIPPHTRRVVELDADELTTGYVALDLDGGAGGRVTLRYAERYSRGEPGSDQAATVRDDPTAGQILGYEDVYLPSGRREQYEPFWFRTFRFVRLEVATAALPLRLRQPTFRETGYPLEVRSHVASPVPWVQPLWEISERTLRRCMHETYEDCPYYEQLQFILDTRLQALFAACLSTDSRLTEKALEDFHASLLPEGMLQDRFPVSYSQIIPAFALQWIMMLHDHYWQTGDITLARRYRPGVDAVLDWFDRKRGPLGLIEQLGYWQFIDWTEEWKETRGQPTAVLHGPSTIHNLLYAYALQQAAELSRVTGRPAVADEYLGRAEQILSGVRRHCWSEERGLVREGPRVEAYSQHAQVWAVLTGLVSGAQARAVMNKSLDEPGIVRCSFALSFFLFRALEQTGLYSRTERLWDRWIGLLPLKITTWPETPWEPRSDCHAWGSLPLYEFTRCLLGVRPGAPGWRGIIVAPQCLTLPSMRGEVTTPIGSVRVAWERRDGIIHLRGTAPPGVPVAVVVEGQPTRAFPHGGDFAI